jgi:hypothetical protein
MPTFVIERRIPDAGKLTPDQLCAIAQQSNAVVGEIGAGYRWHHTYVTDDGMYCVHDAPDEATVREHARRGGFPADTVSLVRTIIDPTTPERGAS